MFIHTYAYIDAYTYDISPAHVWICDYLMCNCVVTECRFVATTIKALKIDWR